MTIDNDDADASEAIEAAEIDDGKVITHSVLL